MKNIVLIGMPGCGKSTCGVLVAKALCMNFIDTDLVIQNNEKAALQTIIDEKGTEYFEKAEERGVCGILCDRAIVATGGSVVYSDKAMQHLKQNGVVVYLKISYNTMMERIQNIKSRGILQKSGETLKTMYDLRQKLYEQYADITVNCDDIDIENAVSDIIKKVNEYGL